MRPPWWGLARGVVVVAVGGGLVWAATNVSGTLSLTPAVEQVAAPQSALVPVASSALSCPGPETEGLAGVPAVAGTTTVYAASPPAAAMTGLAAVPEAGSVALTAVAPGDAAATGTPLAATSVAATVVQAQLTGSTVGRVSATGALAPGVAGLQTTLTTEGDDRALSATACRTPGSDLWLVGGGGGSTRRERVVLTNPGANAVSVDVSVLGQAGALASASGDNVAVPAHGRTSLLVDALVGPEKTPVVHVVATGGAVTATLSDSWVDGAVGRGADDVAPTAEPSNDQVVPGVFVSGPATLRVAVPGNEEAVVQARALTAAGPVGLPGDGVIRIPGSSVREIDLSSLPAGSYAVQVRADKPVVAGVVLERRGTAAQQSDLAWSSSTAPVPVLAGTPLPAGASGSLQLVSTGDTASASVYTVSASGQVTPHTYALAADSTVTLDVSGQQQVWVRQTTGTIRAAVSISVTEGTAGPLFAVVPLPPAVVSATQVPVRQLPG
ncbi:MAG: DUF5719 family protein [Actinomycetota bacterium]|nr:DUF5719 family protein [Actinomycetota bacterium]